jgi:predicted ATP-dependent serine protease
VWDRANRLGLIGSSSGSSSSTGPPPLDVRLMCESDVERIGAMLVEQQPAAAIIDSIQTMRLAQLPSRPGTVTQVRWWGGGEGWCSEPAPARLFKHGSLGAPTDA